MTDDTHVTRRTVLGAIALGAAKMALKLGVASARRADDVARRADDLWRTADAATRAIPPPQGAQGDGWAAQQRRLLDEDLAVDILQDVPFDALGPDDDARD